MKANDESVIRRSGGISKTIFALGSVVAALRCLSAILASYSKSLTSAIALNVQAPTLPYRTRDVLRLSESSDLEVRV